MHTFADLAKALNRSPVSGYRFQSWSDVPVLQRDGYGSMGEASLIG